MITTLPTRLFARLNHNNKAIKTLLMLLFGLLVSNIVSAQVSSYTLTTGTTPSFASLTAAKTNLAATTGSIDSNVTAVTIPFNFNFNGRIYTTANVSLNGFVTLGAVAPGLLDITPISSATNFEAVLAPYAWDLDLVPATTLLNVSHETTGVVGSRIFKVEWFVKRSNNLGTAVSADGGSAANLTFQLWLHEGTNVAQFHYNTFAPLGMVNQSVSTGQVGLRGQSNSDFRNFVLNLGSSFPVGALPFGTANTDVVNLSPNNAGGVAFQSRIPSGSHRVYTWTPPTCFAPINIAISDVLINTATVTFSAPTPAPTGYNYEVRTSGLPGSGAAGLAASGTAVSPQALTGLASDTQYFVYLRSNCPPNSGWSRPEIFRTLCSFANVPYSQSFDLDFGPNADEAFVPLVPNCNKTQNVGTGANWSTGDTSGAPHDASSMLGNVLVYDGNTTPGNTNDANAWFYTRGVLMDVTKTYYIYYNYGGSATTINSMKVAYGSQPLAANMTTILDDHPSFRGTIFTNKVIFSPPSTGVYYFGFHAYSPQNRGFIWVDEIFVDESPCRKPTALTMGTINRTNATVSFTPPTPSPTGGYVYYVGTTPFTPPLNSNTIGSGTIPFGASTILIPGLSPGTNYCVWIRSSCGNGDYGEWSANVCFTTLPPLPALPCIPNPSSVDNQGIVNVTYSTVNNTTVAEIGNYGNYTALIGNIAQGQTLPVAITFNTFGFDYNTRIWVNWNNDGDFADAGEEVANGLSIPPSPTTLTLNFTVPLGTPLGNYTMRIGGSDTNTLTGTGVGEGPCYNGVWGTFEDYTINVVVAPPVLTLNTTTSTQCADTNSTLITITSTIADFDTYTWSPAGVTGTAASGYTINSPITQVYTITGTQTVAPFSTNTAKFTFVATAKPLNIVITPASASICQNVVAPVLLATVGGNVGGFSIPSVEQDFNGTAPGWVATTGPGHGGGADTESLWLLKPNNWNDGLLPSMSSNDASQFYLTNSDTQGSGTSTRTILTSPVFSLVGYTSAQVNFWHNYNYFNTNDVALVEIFNSATSTWETIQNYSTLAVDQGAPRGFELATIDISGYAGMANLQVRFNYEANWGWWWAIDNFKVLGTADSKITWSPIAGLFTDAAGTIPYVAGDFAKIIYAKPSTTTTYTASSQTESPNPICFETETIVVTVQPIAAGTASADQSICFGLPSPITVTGTVGTLVRWQWSNTPTFIVANNVPISGGTNTLSAVKMITPPLTQDRYYRLVITNGACTTFSPVIMLAYDAVIYSAGTWSNGTGPTIGKAAIFDSSYTSTGDLSACTVLVRNGAIVTMDVGHTLTVANTITTATGGKLEFNNNANLLQNTNVTNTFPITYRRTSDVMRVYDFTYWSSPVANQTLFNMSPLTLGDKNYLWDTTLIAYGWKSIPNSSIMFTGRGYAVRSPLVPGNADAAHTAPFTGNPNNGNLTTPIQISGTLASPSTGNRLNLIGNPYPSGLSANLFLAANSSVLHGTIYFWTHNTQVSAAQLVYNNNDYASYNFTGGVGTAATSLSTNNVGSSIAPDGFIAAGQGFFANGLGTSSGIVNAAFNNSMRITNNSSFYRSANNSNSNNATANENANAALLNYEKNRIWLNLTNSDGAFSQMLYGNIEGATNDKDNLYDGELFDSTSAVSLYSLLGTDKLTIKGNGLPFAQTDTNDLGYIANFAGDFTISLANFDGLFDNENIYLEDKLLNVIHDLKLSNYNFNTTVGTFNDRFVLRFNSTTLSTEKVETDNRNIYIYKNANGVNVKAYNDIIDSIVIFDIHGRKLYSKEKINAKDCTINDLSVANQVLLIKAKTTEGKVFTKKVIF